MSMAKQRISKLDRSVKGKVALVTGAASGMGRATAFVFADEGAKVAVTDVRAEGAEEVASQITRAGGEAAAWKLDVANGEEVKRVIDATADRFGGLDILINNAGIALIAPIDAEDYESRWARSIDVLLTAHIRTIRAALPYLRKSSAPRIVNIASTEGLGATARNSPYNAAKTGVIGLTRGLAVELGREGITVNCICPGPIRTGMTESIPEEQKEEYARRRTALRRYGDPEEVAQMTLSLCLPAASFCTGVTLQVDGGLTIRRA
jgi:3-oxoacyl-[acyl-carrier protein] reductase